MKELNLDASRHMFTILAITRSYELRFSWFKRPRKENSIVYNIEKMPLAVYELSVDHIPKSVAHFWTSVLTSASELKRQVRRTKKPSAAHFGLKMLIKILPRLSFHTHSTTFLSLKNLHFLFLLSFHFRSK